jgi:hypothetical protein
MTSQSLPPHRAPLPRWIHPFVLPLLLSFLMTAVISAVSTLMAVGFKSGIFVLWLKAWAWSWLVAFPTLLLVLPVVRRMAAFLTSERAEVRR